MAIVYWSADGAGRDVGTVHNAFIRWMRANGSPALIVNGGDVYDRGTDGEFEAFFQQMDRNVADLCETPGNHDWGTRTRSTATGEIPSGYERFWSRFQPPLSKQPIDVSKRGGARYEHFVDLEGWRLIFLDTGNCDDDNPWPMGDSSRLTWLRETVTGRPGRAKIVFAHHSRLSRGKHGDIEEVDALWQALFDADGTPRAALTVGGHDHAVSIYGPRPRSKPKERSVDVAKGVYIIVNGAGGRGHDTGFRGTRPDLHFDDDNYCVTRINLMSGTAADVDILDFGPNKSPRVDRAPAVRKTLSIRI
jgi:hypothetical protein